MNKNHYLTLMICWLACLVVLLIGVSGCPSSSGDDDDGGNAATCPDRDKDGYYAKKGCGSAVDCNDDNALVYPGAKEACDGIDNQCAAGEIGFGEIDEGCDPETILPSLDGDWRCETKVIQHDSGYESWDNVTIELSIVLFGATAELTMNDGSFNGDADYAIITGDRDADLFWAWAMSPLDDNTSETGEMGYESGPHLKWNLDDSCQRTGGVPGAGLRSVNGNWLCTSVLAEFDPITGAWVVVGDTMPIAVSYTGNMPYLYSGLSTYLAYPGITAYTRGAGYVQRIFLTPVTADSLVLIRLRWETFTGILIETRSITPCVRKS